MEAQMYYLVHANTMSSRWLVAVYNHRETAEQHVKLANEEVIRIEENENKTYQINPAMRAEFPYDRNISRQDVKLQSLVLPIYEVTEVPFVIHVDQYIELVSHK